MQLLAYLSSLIALSPALEAEVAAMAEPITVAKGGALLKDGERCRHLFYIQKGLLRGYYYENGRDTTNWFAQEGEFATCFYAFIAKEPSFEMIQALEDCELMRLPYDALQNLYIAYPETERIGRLIIENYYTRLEERLLGIRLKTAKERYQHFIDTKPSLLQRATLGQVAAYLGITPETLSRIRAGM